MLNNTMPSFPRFACCFLFLEVAVRTVARQRPREVEITIITVLRWRVRRHVARGLHNMIITACMSAVICPRYHRPYVGKYRGMWRYQPIISPHESNKIDIGHSFSCQHVEQGTYCSTETLAKCDWAWKLRSLPVPRRKNSITIC